MISFFFLGKCELRFAIFVLLKREIVLWRGIGIVGVFCLNDSGLKKEWF